MFHKKMISEFHFPNGITLSSYIFIFNKQIVGGYVEGTNAEGITLSYAPCWDMDDVLRCMREVGEFSVEMDNRNRNEYPEPEDLISDSEIDHYNTHTMRADFVSTKLIDRAIVEEIKPMRRKDRPVPDMG